MAEAGRPTELTEEVRRKIEEIAALDGTVEEMAFFAGVHRATLYRWIKDNEELRDRIDELRQRPILKARQTINKALEDPKTAQWYLERKKRKEYGANVDITTDGKQLPAPILPLDVLTDNSNKEDSGTTE